ncbi:hypothetical protein OSTOST_17281 [Ostertagia ostertagi]
MDRNGKWKVQGRTPDVSYIVEDEGQCSCNPSPTGNVHCTLCGVCPYSMTYPDEAGPSSSPVAYESEHHLLPAVEDPIVASQERLDKRKSLRNDIQLSYSLVATNVNALVNVDTEEAMAKLTEIHELIDKASKIRIGPDSQKSQIVVQPDLSRQGAKPKLTKTKLYTVGITYDFAANRSEYRKKRDAGKDKENQP